MKLIVSFILTALATCLGAELILPSRAIERDGPFVLIYKTGLQATGKGSLQVDWTDVLGRNVESFSRKVDLTDENEMRISLDGRRAVAMQNEIRVHFSFKGKNKKGEVDDREEDARLSFIASPPDRTWWDYQIVMWQPNTEKNFAELTKLGVSGGEYSAHSTGLPEFLLKNNLRWYVESIANDFYSEYHRYRPDRPHNEALLEAKALYKSDPTSKEGLKRHPSLSDPEWLERVRNRVIELVKSYSPFRPIFYNLADESGIAELAGLWDFDFSDHSLDPMRLWLKNRYGTLDALNRQWDTHFTRWDLVTPDTTSEAMKRTDENYSAWADHKEWMDKSFADALQVGVDAAHSVDPQAQVGLEGAQMPGWGGYDYARLSQAVSVMEPYDIGDNIEIVRSLNPHLIFITTAFARGPWEKHRVWYELLHGSRGHIIWDEKFDLVQADGTVGPRGQEVAPYYTELRNGVGAQIINSIRQADPIAIHYSQASMRTEWMLAQKPKGDAWLERMSWTERKDSDFLRLRDSYCRLMEDQGLQYKFVSYGEVENGELLRGGFRALILPRSSSLSQAETQQITAFVRQGGTLIIDGDAGTFDEHSRRLAASSLSDLLAGETGRGKVLKLSSLDYHRQRVLGTEAPLRDQMHRILIDAGVQPRYAVTDEKGAPVTGIETHAFMNGEVTLLGLLSNPQLSVDELGPPEFKSNQRFEKPQTVTLHMPVDLYAYDIRHAKPLGRARQLTLTVDPYETVLLSLSATPFPMLTISAPREAKRGQTIALGLSFRGPSPTATHVFHIEVRDGVGKLVPGYSGNVLSDGNGAAFKQLPLALNDAAGTWSIGVKDVLSGQEQHVQISVL